jgi:hypothetical protein
VLVAAIELPDGVRVLARYDAAGTLPATVLIPCPDCTGASSGRAGHVAGLPPTLPTTLSALGAYDHQAAAVRAVQRLLTRPWGWLTLQGGYGSGKSTLIGATLGELAQRGLDGAYWTASGLLRTLREAVGSGSYTTALDRIARTPVLALDELDAFRLTEFAEETLIELFGRRYAMTGAVSLLAANVLGDPIPPRIVSRARDKRFQVVDLGEADLRSLDGGAWDRGEGEL